MNRIFSHLIKSSFLVFAFVMAVQSLQGCSMDPAEDANLQKEFDDRVTLQNQYDALVGSYKGLLHAKDIEAEPIEIEVRLFLVDEPDGVNEDGELKLRPSLKGFYRELSSRSGRSNFPLVVRYYPQTNEISMITDVQGVVFQLQGKVNGTQIKGDATDDRGTLGSFELSKVSNDVGRAPDETIDERRRIREVYEKIKGTYEGLVKRPEPRLEDFPIEVKLFITEEATGVDGGGNVIFKPKLSGYLVRLDIGRDVGDYSMDVQYFVESKVITMKGKIFRNPTAPANIFISFTGVYDDGSITGELSDHRGVLGRANLSKTASN